MTNPLIEIRDLSISFPSEVGTVQAVRNISLDIRAGEVLGIVGESGSGKSVSALALTRLLPGEPTCTITGQAWLDGRDLLALDETEISKVRGKEIAYVFQDPGTSLNPVYTIGFQIGEAVRIHNLGVTDVDAAVIKALEEVHINDPHKVANQYPHELSGGMQQRAMIAMALACNPRILIADEPTTALDVTIQKEIMDLLGRLRKDRGMSILLITHNFGIVANFADHVQVMRHGRVVESGTAEHVMNHPTDPYTKGLIACIPRLGQRRHRLTTLNEELSKS